MLNTAAAALIALSMFVPVTASAEEEPTSARLDVVTVNGSGCPAGDADVRTDGRTFSIGYHTFLARAGGGSSPLDMRKNCQVNIRVSVPDGYTYGLSRTSYDGYAHLQEGATALNRLSIYIQGQSPTTTVNHPFSGPVSDEWDPSTGPAPPTSTGCRAVRGATSTSTPSCGSPSAPPTRTS